MQWNYNMYASLSIRTRVFIHSVLFTILPIHYNTTMNCVQSIFSVYLFIVAALCISSINIGHITYLVGLFIILFLCFSDHLLCVPLFICINIKTCCFQLRCIWSLFTYVLIILLFLCLVCSFHFFCCSIVNTR